MSFQDNNEQCKKCGEKYMSRYDAKYEWCKSCQINDLKKNFTNWTSENERIDNLIQEMQLEINEIDDMVFEWIPYNEFNDIYKFFFCSTKLFNRAFQIIKKSKKHYSYYYLSCK